MVSSLLPSRPVRPAPPVGGHCRCHFRIQRFRWRRRAGGARAALRRCGVLLGGGPLLWSSVARIGDARQPGTCRWKERLATRAPWRAGHVRRGVTASADTCHTPPCHSLPAPPSMVCLPISSGRPYILGLRQSVRCADRCGAQLRPVGTPWRGAIRRPCRRGTHGRRWPLPRCSRFRACGRRTRHKAWKS